MELILNKNLSTEISNREKRTVILFSVLLLIIMGFTLYCIRALFNAIENNGLNKFLWFFIFFVEIIAILYCILKLREHIIPIFALKDSTKLKVFEVSILDIDTAWCFDTILYRPCVMMELSWNEEDSLALIEGKKEKEIAELVRKALLLYKEDNLLGAYVLNDENQIV